MRPHFLAFRRVLPGGMIVLVSLAVADDGQVRGILQVERRRDPSRQLFGTAPLIAEATGPTQQDVLRQLRELAENDALAEERDLADAPTVTGRQSHLEQTMGHPVDDQKGDTDR